MPSRPHGSRAEPDVTYSQRRRARRKTTTPLNAQRPHERWWRPLKPTSDQLPPSLVVTWVYRQRSGMPEGTCGAAARSIAVRVLPVATRLATATAGKTSPRTKMMVITRLMIRSGRCQSSESTCGDTRRPRSLRICVCVCSSQLQSPRTKRAGPGATPSVPRKLPPERKVENRPTFAPTVCAIPSGGAYRLLHCCPQ